MNFKRFSKEEVVNKQLLGTKVKMYFSGSQKIITN
jgi:hypothetical protein